MEKWLCMISRYIYIYIFLSFSRADGSMEEGRKEGMESWWSSLLICTRLECGPLY